MWISIYIVMITVIIFICVFQNKYNKLKQLVILLTKDIIKTREDYSNDIKCLRRELNILDNRTYNINRTNESIVRDVSYSVRKRILSKVYEVIDDKIEGEDFLNDLVSRINNLQVRSK